MANLERFLLRILGILLGATAAGCLNPAPPVPEYGMPLAEYTLGGKVQDAQTGAGLPGIVVKCGQDAYTSATTHADGTWTLIFKAMPPSLPTFDVTAQDTDGTQNGAYQSATVLFVPARVAYGVPPWDLGSFGKTDLIIPMPPAP